MPIKARTCLIICFVLDTSYKDNNTCWFSNCHCGSCPMIFLPIWSFLHCSRHLLTSFLYDLAFPCSMNLL